MRSIAILAGAKGMVEVKKRVLPDMALQRAFGREGCAEQSTIQDTLNASTEENVKQMREALAEIFFNLRQVTLFNRSQVT
jgi:hypothetical protein